MQDLAQPQHTRNDAHLVNGVLGKGVYEGYTNTRALGKNLTCFNGQAKTSDSLVYDIDYPEVRFDRYKYFFSTNPGPSGNVVTGTGIADYSNRSFFTAGTNIDNTTYSEPPTTNIAGDYRADPTPEVDPTCLPENLKYVLNVHYRREVADTLYPSHSKDDVALSAEGIWTRKFLGLVGYEKQGYGLTKTIYTEMADLLIPRAVAYGAGLIDYFFRGRLAISLPDEGIYGIIDHATDHAVINNIPKKGQSGDGGVFGFEKILLNVTNATPDINEGPTAYPQTVGTGTLRAVAHYRHNPCYTTDLSGETVIACDTASIEAQPMTISTSAPLSINSLDSLVPTQFEFDFSAEPIPVNAVDLRIQVVFRGDLGAEKGSAIAVGMRNISEPTYMAFRNSTDYFSLDGTNYPPLQITSDPLLLKKIDVNPVDGVPDVPIDPTSIDPGTVSIGNANGVIQTNAPLMPEEYVRVAVLGDYGTVPIMWSFPNWSDYEDFSLRVVEWYEPGAYYVFSPLEPLGGSGGELYFFDLLRLIRDPYPPGSTPGPSADYVNVQDPGAEPVTICFPATACGP